MDKGTIIGSITGLGCLLFAVMLSGPRELMLFWSVPSLLIIFGGVFAAAMIAFPLGTVLKSATYIRQCFVREEQDPRRLIEQITSFAETARRSGLLALEHRLGEIADPFFADGLQLAVDGTTPENVEKILRAEIESMSRRHRRGRALILHYGKLAPALGMIGTLVGLVLMFAHLEPDNIGPGMAVAILTTLYGAVAAYLFLLPVAEKLGEINELEIEKRELILKGILSIQNGEHPRMIQMKLQTFLPPDERTPEQLNEQLIPLQNDSYGSDSENPEKIAA
jgi:chemotaxis protein MotA